MHALIVLLLVAASAIAQAVELPAKYRSAGVVRWGADAEGGAPFVYVDPAHGERGEIGFEVDLARELARVLGVRWERVQAPYENLVPALERGDFDVVLNGFEPTPSRRTQVRFSRPYYVFQQQLTVGPGTTGIRMLGDLVGKRVGVLGQSQSHQLVLATPGVEAVIYESNVTAYQDVISGRVAASLADLPIARALRSQFPTLVDVGQPFGEFYYAMAVRRGEPELQRAIDQAIAALWRDGSLERIYRRWDLWVPVETQLGDARLAGMFADSAAGEGAAGAMDWGHALALLGRGALTTIVLSVIAFALAVVLGLGVALARLYGGPVLRTFAIAWVELLRGTPILVQMLLLYYGLGQIEGLRLPAEVAGVLGLALNYCAYEAEIWRGALLAIPRGQREAASALGLTTAQSLRHVLLPQALRSTLAPSTNDFIALFKDSSIVMVITVVELTKQYQMLANATGRFILLGLLTSAIYLAMSLPLAWLARRFELALDREAA